MPYNGVMGDRDINRLRDRDWFVDPTRKADCPRCGTSVLTVSRTFFNMGWNNGFRGGISRTARLSPALSEFVTLINWLMRGSVDTYMELYIAARDVWGSAGRVEGKLERLGHVLAKINSGEVET